MQDLIDAFIADCASYNKDNPSSGWRDFLLDKCDINLDNLDTGAIIGFDAGGSEIKTADNIVPEYANYYEALTNAAQSINTGSNGWIIRATSGSDTIISGGDDSIFAGAGYNCITLNGSASTLDASGGYNSVFVGADAKSVFIFNYDSSKVTLSGNTSVVSFDSASSAAFSLNDNDNFFNTVGSSIFTGSELIKVDLNKAIDAQNPVPVGGFIAGGSDEANFVSTSSDSLVGHVASLYPELLSFTFGGLTLNVCDRRFVNSDGSRTILKTFSDFNDLGTDSSTSDTDNLYEKYIVASIYKWWLKESLNLNFLDYAYSFNDPDASIFTINLHFDKTSGGSSALAAVQHSYNPSSSFATALDLIINKDYYYTLTDFDDFNGSNSFVYLDRTLAHEFNHALMAAKVNYFAYLPKFIKEGLAELTHGIDDKRTYSIQQLAKNSDSLSSVINLDNEYTSQDYSYAGGYMLLRYLAKQAALNTQDIFTRGEISAQVDLTSANATYYVPDTLANPLASTIHSAYSVGSALNYVYTPATNIKQFITTNSDSWRIDSLPSNDTLLASGSVTVSVAGDSNFVSLSGSSTTNKLSIAGRLNSIFTASGLNEISITAPHNTLRGSNGIDRLTVSAANELSLGGGDDYALLMSSSVSVYAGSGADSIETYYSNNTSIYVDAGTGNDYLEAGGTQNFFAGGAGNDSIYITGIQNSISADTGSDTITFAYYSNASANASNYVDAGAGDDLINLYSYAQTIVGGVGNDTINRRVNQGGNYFAYNSHFGDDIIINFTQEDIIQIPDNFTATQSGSVVTIKKGEITKGTITLQNYTGTANVISGAIAEENWPFFLEGTESNDTLENKLSGATILAYDGDDLINNSGASVTIDAGAGNDYVSNSGSNVTISGGAGKDTLYGGTGADILYGGDNNDVLLGDNGNDKLYGDANNDSLSGGNGNDKLYGDANNDTLIGGKGDDSLWGGTGADTFLYEAGDGRDVIFGITNRDLLQITGTFSGTYNKSKKEIYFKVGSMTNAITLKNYSATSFNINGDTYSIKGTSLRK